MRMTTTERRLLILLTASIFINYIDRSNLSVAAPFLSAELSLTGTRLGALLASCFWTYALVQLFGIAGWLTDRFPVGWVLGIGFFIWSGATAASGFVTGFAGLFAMRLILGAGEAVEYPCYSKILASESAQHHRGLANALIDAGLQTRPGTGYFSRRVADRQPGLASVFSALGQGGLVWLIPWFMYMPRDKAAVAVAKHQGPGTVELLSQRSAWGAFFAHFCGNYYWFFLLTWLPTYLVRERGYTANQMAFIGSIAYFAVASATVIAGWYSDRKIRAGISPTIVRKACVTGGLIGSTIILPVAAVQNNTLSTVLLLLACMSFGVYTSNHWAITQILAGPLSAGRWTGIQNGVGNLSGIAAPWLTGLVVEKAGAFYFAFLIAAGVSLAGAFLWGLVVGPVEMVKWRSSAES